MSLSSAAVPKDVADELLMCRYRDGDINAFSALYGRHKDSLYRYIYRQVGESALTDDLSQDIWKKVIDAAKSYEPAAQFNTWLYTIASNRIKDHGRRLSVVNKHIDSSTDDKSETAIFDHHSAEHNDAIFQQQLSYALKHCLKKLPALQLQSFLLKEEAGFTAPQIANITGVTLEASKSRLRYAMQALRDCLTVWKGSSDD